MPSCWVIIIPSMVNMALTSYSGYAGSPAPAPAAAAASPDAAAASPDAAADAGFAAILFYALLKLWHA